jgi:predicted dinucleotide-binding enzyme
MPKPRLGPAKVLAGWWDTWTLGFEALDAGDLTKARLLEPYAMVWINQALLRGKGRDWAFAAVKRD